MADRHPYSHPGSVSPWVHPIPRTSTSHSDRIHMLPGPKPAVRTDIASWRWWCDTEGYIRRGPEERPRHKQTNDIMQADVPQSLYIYASLFFTRAGITQVRGCDGWVIPERLLASSNLARRGCISTTSFPRIALVDPVSDDDSIQRCRSFVREHRMDRHLVDGGLAGSVIGRRTRLGWR